MLQAYRSWRGTFKAFCNHVQFHCRIPISRQHISDILQAHGIRIPKRRGGRPADASALRGAFDTFHPGAQWIGDGTELVVTINGQAYVFNLQLNVDVSSGAFVGASVRPTEDSAAVVQAFADGVATTGAPPLALLLDNKPSNHTDEVVAALGDTIKLRARPYTPTDKPHVEGAFGLFAQQTPQMNIDADDYPASRTRSPFSSSPPGPGPSTTDHGPNGAGAPGPISTEMPAPHPRRSRTPTRGSPSASPPRTRRASHESAGQIHWFALHWMRRSPASASTTRKPRSAPRWHPGPWTRSSLESPSSRAGSAGATYRMAPTAATCAASW